MKKFNWLKRLFFTSRLRFIIKSGAKIVKKFQITKLFYKKNAFSPDFFIFSRKTPELFGSLKNKFILQYAYTRARAVNYKFIYL